MNINTKIKALAEQYRTKLEEVVANRVIEMEDDNEDHHLVYKVLGVTLEEGRNIDIYQNKGRFLYKYSGSFIEEATKLCFKEAFPDSSSIRIENTISPKPKTVEIDCLVGNRAYEIKWKDATTDGDHITKEHTRIKVIRDKGLVPVRIMFFMPNRGQAIKIQGRLKELYSEIGGEYYAGKEAWAYVRNRTGVDLFKLLDEI
jgi:type II restriction enzyme